MRVKPIKCQCCGEIIARSAKELAEKIDGYEDDDLRLGSDHKGKSSIFCSQDCACRWYTDALSETYSGELNENIEDIKNDWKDYC